MRCYVGSIFHARIWKQDSDQSVLCVTQYAVNTSLSACPDLSAFMCAFIVSLCNINKPISPVGWVWVRACACVCVSILVPVFSSTLCSWCVCGWSRPPYGEAPLCGAGAWNHGFHLWWYPATTERHQHHDPEHLHPQGNQHRSPLPRLKVGVLPIQKPASM